MKGIKKEVVSIAIDLEVFDETEFRLAARDRALADGLDVLSASTFLDEELTSLGDCAQMLLDPGVSPVGSTIIQSRIDE